MAQDHAVPDDGEQALVPGEDNNNDPTPPLPAEKDDGRAAQPNPSAGVREEPEIASERDIPSDGADTVGEGMIKNLGVAADTAAAPAVCNS